MKNLESGPSFQPDQETEPKGPLYKTAIVLGGGFRKDKLEVLTMESKMRTLAAGILAQEGKIGRLIFTGGKTSGSEISEAQAMKDYLLEKFPNLADFQIGTEGESFDTIENARNVAKQMADTGESSALLLSNATHIPRSQETFERFGIETDGISAEELIGERSPAHQRLAESYQSSARNKKQIVIESILRGVAKVDPDGKLISQLARTLRGGK
ncbi:MAG: YdcF family protein [Candidatus Berkelbacteria bacterium]|nr:YdcF family protein [Candidatus Berkelbacteria bacterium]